MINALNSAIAGLLVHAQKLATAANNIANYNTDGYKKNRAVVEANVAGYPEVNITTVDSPGSLVPLPEGLPEGDGTRETSNVDLAEEMVNMMIAEKGFKANLKTIQTQEELLGSILDIIS